VALVTYVLGDCPACKTKDAFGNVDVYRTYVLRGCMRCQYREDVPLPAVRKKVLYLDQFFFSHAFRGGDARFVGAAERIARLASLQLAVAPFSSIHEDETHQWEKRDELLKFIKKTSRGHEFNPSYEVEKAQILESFQAWLSGGSSADVLNSEDALDEDVHAWESYMRIDVGRYMGDIELIRDLKRQSSEGLVNLFEGWRQLKTSFEEDLEAEHHAAAQGYLNFYVEFAARVASGDYMAMFDAPVMSLVVQAMLQQMDEGLPIEQRIRRCAEFLRSSQFKELPYQWLHAHMLASLKHLVKKGFYTNREQALKKLNGFFYDVKHIATYAPYVDAFVMDQPMADLVSRPTVNLAGRYGTQVFSLNNWDSFLAWLDQIEESMDAQHLEGLHLAYPTHV